MEAAAATISPDVAADVSTAVAVVGARIAVAVVAVVALGDGVDLFVDLARRWSAWVLTQVLIADLNDPEKCFAFRWSK